MALEIGPLLGAISILMFLSWLFFRRNPAFDIAEALFVGSAAAFNFIIGIKAVRDNAVYPLLAGDLRVLIPIILSIMLY
ncbi:hypothetical protein KEJ33_06360, partial [Candidatus Bathyarchaeota archaeon]|nr:hypothetical protein [Candidatus Bathyarchaeota archaeon]